MIHSALFGVGVEMGGLEAVRAGCPVQACPAWRPEMRAGLKIGAVLNAHLGSEGLSQQLKGGLNF